MVELYFFIVKIKLKQQQNQSQWRKLKWLESTYVNNPMSYDLESTDLCEGNCSLVWAAVWLEGGMKGHSVKINKL